MKHSKPEPDLADREVSAELASEQGASVADGWRFGRIALPELSMQMVGSTPMLAAAGETLIAILGEQLPVEHQLSLFFALTPCGTSPGDRQAYEERLRANLLEVCGSVVLLPESALLVSPVVGDLAARMMRSELDNERPSSVSEKQRGLLRAFVRALLVGGIGANAIAPIGREWVSLQLLSGSATGEEYMHLLESERGRNKGLGSPLNLSDVRREVAEALSTLSNEYSACSEMALELQMAVRESIARAVEPALNGRMASLPHESYEDKKALAKWVNAELRDLGLAIRCPKTGLPAVLLAGPGGRPDAGRFLLEVKGPRGVPKRTLTSVALPELSLMVPPIQRKPGTEEPGRSV